MPSYCRKSQMIYRLQNYNLEIGPTLRGFNWLIQNLLILVRLTYSSASTKWRNFCSMAFAKVRLERRWHLIVILVGFCTATYLKWIHNQLYKTYTATYNLSELLASFGKSRSLSKETIIALKSFHVKSTFTKLIAEQLMDALSFNCPLKTQGL